MRRFFALLLVLILIFACAALALGWWIVHRGLPQLDGIASLPELKQEVTVDRDAWGVSHIRAGSVEDLMTAQGYVLAQDRLWQMDILRRVAAGELSEIFGPATVQLDRQYRTLGLRVAAQREAESLDPELRAMLDAYARGVNRYIAERGGALPWEFVAMRYKPRPWTRVDSLLIAGYMYQTLTNTWRLELHRAQVTARVGPELAKDLFIAEAPEDHTIVDFPAAPAGNAAPAQPAPENQKPDSHPGSAPSVELARVAPAQLNTGWKAAQKVLAQFDADVRAGIGSNNWVVDGTHTASGKPLLANDTHLQLSVPCIWYIVHLTAPGWNVQGFALPGAPGVVIGHNDRIAWGFTNNGADVQDLYLETFNPQSPREYRVNGQWVKADVRTERVRVRGEQDTLFDVIVTRHGPIVAREGTAQYALRWTATEPGGLGATYGLLGRAQNWQEFREAMRRVPGPAQNAVYADVDGNIGFIVAARIPVRKNGDGSAPVPGDTDDYEWISYIPFDELPQVLNPPGGIIATANSRTVGPHYPHYLTDRWASPFRTARIYALLEQKKDFRPADFLSIQNDVFSQPHKFLAEQLVAAAKSAQTSDPRARDLIARLAAWDGRAQASSVETSFLEYTRTFVLDNLLRPSLGNDVPLYEWRDSVFLEKMLRERPARWLPRKSHSYDELLMASADQAAQRLTRDTHSTETSAWRWGKLNALVMDHPLGRSGILHRLLSIGPTEQEGAIYSIKAAQPSHGPAMRFVADLSNWDNSLMNVTLGQSGQYASPHYRDQFPYWLEGRGIAAPFTDAAEEKARAHRLRLVPAGSR